MSALIHGVGCSLIDYLYTDIDFGSPRVQAYRSSSPGDGGLEPGKLVFADRFAEFAGEHYLDALARITEGRDPSSENLGGPAVVALVHAAQMFERAGERKGEAVRFYGLRGNDSIGERIMHFLDRTPLDIGHYHVTEGVSPFTYVLSDPTYAEGQGERMFINNIGAAYEMVPERIPEAFFEAPILLYGGTALVPNLHARLDEALERGRASGALNVVTTVYDFYNQSRDPKGRWPIGRSERSYPNIDLLITDLEEARRLSGAEDPAAALDFFREAGVGAAIITHGNNDVHLFAADDSRFAPLSHTAMPVSARVASELAAGAGANGDTTGCGDNFCGGVLYALAEQYRSSPRAPEKGGAGTEASNQGAREADARERYDLMEALRWGIVSGGFACFYVGGTYFEEHPDQKRSALVPYYEAYLGQGAGS